MGKLYIHHVGKEGASRDFPKTVFQKVDIEVIRSKVDERYRDGIIHQLMTDFPSGQFNVWGVPEPADIVIRNLNRGDFVLLMGQAQQIERNVYEGKIVALCEVRVFPRVTLPTLSEALWGESKFPFIFFFETEELEGFTWQILATDLEYTSTYFPRGQFMSVSADRFSQWGSPDHYIAQLRKDYSGVLNSILLLSEEERQRNTETDEEQSVSIEKYLEARIALRSKLKEIPELTDDSKRDLQLVSKPARSLAFKTDVRQIYQNRCAICGRGLHSPKGHPEVQSAHIYPRSKNGSDDLRNGVTLCSIHHWALDRGWISFSDDHYILIRSDIPATDDFKIISDYAGKKIRLPDNIIYYPAAIYLAAHRQMHGFE